MSTQDENVLISGMNQPYSLHFDSMDEAVRTAVKESSLYTDAAYITEEDLSAELDLVGSHSTNGWDTVSICRVSALNEQIKIEKTYPKSIDYTLEGISLDAQFDPWQIVPGGGEKNVQLKVPIMSGTFKGQKGNYNVAGVSADVMVRLDYFPLSDHQELKDGNYSLHVNTRGGTESNPIAAVINLADPKKVLSMLDKSSLRQLIHEWLNIPENLKKFETLFSTVLINNLGKQSEEFKWLRATSISYAYTDRGDLNSSVFGVLCMTNNRPKSTSNQIPAVKLNDDNNAMLLINREVFIKYQFLAGLPFIFKGTKPSDYTLDDAGTTINAKNLNVGSISYAGVDYQPEIKKFEVSFDENYVRTTSHLTTQIAPGISTCSIIVTKHTLKLHVNTKGEQIMKWVNVGDPLVNTTVLIETWLKVTQMLIALGFSVAAAASGKFIEDIVRRVIFLIVVLIGVAVMNIIIEVIFARWIAGGVTDDLPSIEPMVRVVANEVKWPFCEQDAFVLTQIIYSGVIIFKGSLKLKPKYTIIDGRLALA